MTTRLTIKNDEILGTAITIPSDEFTFLIENESDFWYHYDKSNFILRVDKGYYRMSYKGIFQHVGKPEKITSDKLRETAKKLIKKIDEKFNTP
jgi:hypothetical protein